MSLLLTIFLTITFTAFPPVRGLHDTFTDEDVNPAFEPAGYKLYNYVKSKYNKYVLPVDHASQNINILLLLKLVQLTDIDERNQIMTTTVWVQHEWHDSGLVWNPSEHGNITKIQLPSENVWLPDTVLYNNAEGNYQITIKTKVQANSDGRIMWVPPAIYKSFCMIDVTFFPFDMQTCMMKFGPWSYDTSKVDYWIYDYRDLNKTLVDNLTQAADMTEFSKSVEWDILQITAQRTTFRYPCCPDEYVDVTYRIFIRRKTLYYTINLILPCVFFTFLTVLVFYLPSDSAERITLSVSILVALTVFFLLLNEIIPPTSLAFPLMSKYLLFTIVIVSFSIMITTLILNIHFRHPHMLDMPPWVRRVFLEYLPKLLFYDSPLEEWYRKEQQIIKKSFKYTDSMQGHKPYNSDYLATEFDSSQHPRYENLIFMEHPLIMRAESGEIIDRRDIIQALKDVQLIANKTRDDIEDQKRAYDWEAVGRILDHFCIIIFTAVVVTASAIILMSAPALYDTTPIIA